MATKDKEKIKAANRRYYQKNKQRYRKLNEEHKERARQFVLSYKMERGCQRCPERHEAVLVLHHRDPKAKDVDLATAVCNMWSEERLLAEMEKCDVLCANCHLKLHWAERQ